MSKSSTSLWFHNVEICVRLPLLTLLPFTPYRCPFCNFPALLDKDMSLFSCPNPRCRKVSPLSTLSHQGGYLCSCSSSCLHISVSCSPVSEFYRYVRQRHSSHIKRKFGGSNSVWGGGQNECVRGWLMNCFMVVMKWSHLERSPPPSPSVLSGGLLPLSEECRGEASCLPRPSHGSQTKKSIICQKCSHT